MNEEEKDDLQRIKEKLRQTEEASLGFSAKGYIGRVKYGISFIAFFLATALAVAINSSGDNGGFILLLVCLLWVILIWVYPASHKAFARYRKNRLVVMYSVYSCCEPLS